MRFRDHRRHCRLVLCTEAVDQQRLEVAKRDSAIDRPARREGDDQSVGAAGEPFGALGRILDPRQARLELGDARRIGLCSGRLRHRLRIEDNRLGSHQRRRLLRRHDAKEAGGGLVMG